MYQLKDSLEKHRHQIVGISKGGAHKPGRHRLVASSEPYKEKQGALRGHEINLTPKL